LDKQCFSLQFHFYNQVNIKGECAEGKHKVQAGNIATHICRQRHFSEKMFRQHQTTDDATRSNCKIDNNCFPFFYYIVEYYIAGKHREKEGNSGCISRYNIRKQKQDKTI
jgi:hypothetical protein